MIPGFVPWEKISYFFPEWAPWCFKGDHGSAGVGSKTQRMVPWEHRVSHISLVMVPWRTEGNTVAL